MRSFDTLRKLLPRNDKMDKATFLKTAVDYIKNLQVLKECLT